MDRTTLLESRVYNKIKATTKLVVNMSLLFYSGFVKFADLVVANMKIVYFGE